MSEPTVIKNTIWLYSEHSTGPDPEAVAYRRTNRCVHAPHLFIIIRYVQSLLCDDLVVQESFRDLLRPGDDWATVVAALRSPKTCPLHALMLPDDGTMAATHRGFGPTGALIFWDNALVEALEKPDIVDAKRLNIMFICIVTLLHEMRHWARGVIRGWGSNSDLTETYGKWLYKDRRGESGFLGEYRLWDGILLIGFQVSSGVDRRQSTAVRFQSSLKEDPQWSNVEAVGQTRGIKMKPLSKLYVYTSEYVAHTIDLVHRNAPFVKPELGRDILPIGSARWDRTTIDGMKLLRSAKEALASKPYITPSTSYPPNSQQSYAADEVYGPNSAHGQSPSAPLRRHMLLTKTEERLKAIFRPIARFFTRRPTVLLGDIQLRTQVPHDVREINFLVLRH